MNARLRPAYAFVTAVLVSKLLVTADLLATTACGLSTRLCRHPTRVGATPVAPAANMAARQNAMFIALLCFLLESYLLVQAAGRQLLATTNSTGIYYGEQRC